MIVARTEQVRSLLADVNTAERTTGEAESIRETVNKLRELREVLESIRARHLMVKDRLVHESNKQINQAFDELIDRVRVSRSDFDQQPRQAQRLQQVISSASQLANTVDESWSTYANGKVHPYRELLILVRELPEMRLSVGRLDQLRNRLGTLASQTPRSETELEEFDEKFREFRTDLEAVEGLTPSVREFLQRAVQGVATIADLKDEVLDWCQSGDRAQSFNIRLTSEQW